MKKPPYPALVKPDAVVLLPPEESEERDPRGLWPEPRRRSRWTSLLVIGVIFIAGLGLGLRLASRAAPASPETPEPVEGPVASAGTPTPDDVGAMDAEALPPAANAQDSTVGRAPVVEQASDPPTNRTVVPPEPGPAPRRATAGSPGRGGAEPASVPDRRAELASAPPATTPDTTPLELAPAPVGRTLIQQAEPVAASVPSPLALEPPPPDPAAVREEARQALSRGAERFAAAVGQARSGSTAALSSQVLASDAAARSLLTFVRDSRPAASVAGLGPVTVRDGTAQADATVQLEWRGDFGVTRRGQVRVRLIAREGEGEWRLAGAQPLDGSPR